MLIPFGVFSAGVSSGNGGAGSFDLISTTVLGSSAASVTFDVTGLGSTYKHLQIRYAARSTFSTHASSFVYRLNGDTASNYSVHRLLGTGSAVSSDAGTSTNYGEAGYVTGASATSGNFGGGVLDILDAFSTSKYKTSRVLTGVVGSTNRIGLHSGSWRSTSAITSVTVWSYDGNVDTGSRFSIYGVKG